MNRVVFSNRRVPTRFYFNIPAKLVIINKNLTIVEKEITIINISIDGMEIIFQDNEFLFNFLGTIDEDSTIKVDFEYEKEKFSFNCEILWLSIEDKGERHFVTYSGLTLVKNKETYIKDRHLDLLVSNAMQNLYIP